MTTKNSCARNLSRLLSGVAFISSLLQRLAADPAVSLRCAAVQTGLLTVGVQGSGFQTLTARCSAWLRTQRSACGASRPKGVTQCEGFRFQGFHPDRLWAGDV